MKKVSDFIFEYIASTTDVRHVFMLPGGGCMHLVDSLGRNKHFDFICNLHEQASAIAAEAYSQYNNQLGITLVTTGPGATNAITGVAGAWIDSTPMLILSGQAKTTDLIGDRGVRQMGIQEVDIIPIVTPVTKYATRVMKPERIKYELQKALYLATHGRKGPVWLDMPLDVQGAMIDDSALLEFIPPDDVLDVAALEKNVERLLDIVFNSKRPAILAGNAIRHDDAVADFVALAERLGIPVMTTWKAADFLPEDHPLFVGRPGIVAQRGANFVQQTCDCLLIMGTRLDLCQTGFNHPHFAPVAKKIIIDIDPAEIKKLEMPFELQITANIGDVITELLKITELYQTPDFSSWLKTCKEWQQRFPVILPEYCLNAAIPVNTYCLIETLSDVLPVDAVIVPGSSGNCAEITLQAMKLKHGQRLQNTPGLGSMGFGLPASIGACIASGGKITVGIIGDGGLQHNIQELETLKRLNLPIKIFILNNNGYGSIYNMQKNRFNGNLVACNPESGLTLPDTCKVAQAYGLNTCRIENQLDLKQQIQKVLDIPGTVICDVCVDATVQTAPRLSSKVLPDGQMESLPMEDLWPFLEREEFNSIMSITGKSCQ
jgi:acetolactate synthase-1/2/3 large subunit